ncbi:hypothetical protein BH20ACT2_BH20ACT2_24160 [soil metagenome]
MRVVVGPLPSASVQAWVAYAREVLDDTVRGPASLAVPLDRELLDAFGRYLDEWEGVAATGPEFAWSTELDGEMAEYLLHGFHRVVEHLAEVAAARGVPLGPAAGDVFYVALVGALLDGLIEEGPAGAEFGEYLRNFWPGLPDNG